MATLPAHAEGSSSIDVIDASTGSGGRGLMFSQTRARDKLLHALLASVLPPSHLSSPRPPLLHENLHSECPVARPHSSKWAEFAEPPAGDCKGTDMERNVESGRGPEAQGR